MSRKKKIKCEYRSSKHNQTTEKAEFEDRRKRNGQRKEERRTRAEIDLVRREKERESANTRKVKPFL